MAKHGLIDHKIFSVYMSFENDNNGEVLFGKINTNYMATNFDFFPVTSDDYW